MSIPFSSQQFTVLMAQPVPPKRGGIHPTYGVFIVGGDLDDEYKLTGPLKTNYFWLF